MTRRASTAAVGQARTGCQVEKAGHRGFLGSALLVLNRLVGVHAGEGTITSAVEKLADASISAYIVASHFRPRRLSRCWSLAESRVSPWSSCSL